MNRTPLSRLRRLARTAGAMRGTAGLAQAGARLLKFNFDSCSRLPGARWQLIWPRKC
jgi:hypothetical protein